MDLLIDKFKEVISSVVPIVIIVALLAIFFVDIPADMIWRFVIGAIFLVIGLTIFLFGIDIGMEPIGKLMGRSVAENGSKAFAVILSFILGFAVTVAEPDLLILGQQINDATGGALSTGLIVGVVSIGVGIMIAFGVYRVIISLPIKYFFLIAYGIIFLLCLFSENVFIAMGFDASGATTGALTTPFILALGASVSHSKGGDSAEDDSFGLVGAMSTGPIIGVLAMTLLLGTQFQGSTEDYIYTTGILAPFVNSIGHTFLESLVALIPIVVVYIIMNWRFFKLKRRQIRDINIGIVYTLLGLTLFLVGVNAGFMDMGRFLGTELTNSHANWLPFIGFIMGFFVVLAEPAVHVLGDQVEDVTGGYIPNKLLMTTLSIGVGLAVAMSMLRLEIPALELWHFLLPGFGLAIILSFAVPDLFTGIAFDAGGVASGPMTATFILAFSQGVASSLSHTSLVDGFGIIAMVAMVPVVAIQILGLVFKIRAKKA
ncbi:hypothetical protein AWM75_01925 [Aerococcus urinaehominis]|uniref:Uncharacterized protein n=1 Tax=Aerococcus urinaehominis TaxID=128944 RepID=A0A0X8FK76_9LACT|nr:DUF1538 domain-containing protein [Aerococcus urinaehominis]AMB98825.1 hypothetical protein AWM75_01925 [Aerococcus urinaehominis]SDM48760.1 Protein of unknown function [Aerococcus urinaehominis]